MFQAPDAAPDQAGEEPIGANFNARTKPDHGHQRNSIWTPSRPLEGRAPSRPVTTQRHRRQFRLCRKAVRFPMIGRGGPHRVFDSQKADGLVLCSANKSPAQALLRGKEIG